MLSRTEVEHLSPFVLTVDFLPTESDNASPTSSAAENCGRLKRRRMLQFSSSGEECIPASSPAFESTSVNNSPFVVCP